jgi:hypothetical protein
MDLGCEWTSDVRIRNKKWCLGRAAAEETLRNETVHTPLGPVFLMPEYNCRRRNMYSETAANQAASGRTGPRAAVSLALGCRLSVSDHCMDDCPITVWYGGSVTMLKRHPPGR